jgi:hypothetical protein
MIEITLPSGATHILDTFPDGTPDYDAYSASINTRAVLKTAKDAGDWEPYTPPEPGPEPPDSKAFKIALMAHPLFLQWQANLPAIAREDLKFSAMVENWPLVQSQYNTLKLAVPPPTDAIAQWQTIADERLIPLTF